MKTLIKLMISGICMVSAHTVQAGCTSSGGDITIGSVTILIDGVSKTIGDTLTTQVKNYSVTCDSNLPAGSSFWVLHPHGSNGDYGASAISDIRNMNFAGAGLKWSSTNNTTGVSQLRSSGALNDTNNTLRVAPGSTVTIAETFSVVKTGTISSASTPQMILRVGYRAENAAPDASVIATITINSMIVTASACTVTTGITNVNMGTLSRGGFTGIGSTAAARSFNIPIECTMNTPVKITFNGNSSNTYGVLDLAGGSTASGVGIQILYQGTPLPLASVQDLGTHSAGTFTVPFTARYYQTGSTVTPGTANATATVTLTYN